MNERMTDKQGGKIHFNLYHLPGWGMSNWKFRKLQEMNSDRLFSKKEASELIDDLLVIAEYPKTSQTYIKTLEKIEQLMNKK